MALNVSEYRRLYEGYLRGEVSESRLKAAYRTLRYTTNYRIRSMEDRGLGSNALDAIEFYNRAVFGRNGAYTLVGAIRGQDDWLTTYAKMLDFLESPTSTVKGYQKFLEIAGGIGKEFFENTGQTWHSGYDSVFFKLYDTGVIFEIFHAFGNSPEVQKDMEALVNGGASFDDIMSAFNRAKKAIAIGDIDVYDMMLRDVRRNQKARRDNYYGNGNG